MAVKILAVDDVESNLTALEALLGDADWTIVRAGSGRAALEALRKDQFSLVLLDVQMPEMDGFDTAAAIRAEEKSGPIPIMFLTAHDATQDKLAKAYAVGASELLQKPLDPAALRAKVRTIADLWRRIERVRQEAEKDHQEQLIAERVRWETHRRVERETEELRRRAADQESVAASEHKARVEAEETSRLKDDFLATLSHELRTPLNAILGWTALLRRRRFDPASLERAVEVIDRNAKAQAKLIDDMLDISRIVAGKLRLDVQPVLLQPIVERVVESFRPAAEQKNLAVSVNVDRSIPVVSGDPDRLQQIVANLVSNAVKFTPNDGHIEVRLARQGDAAVLDVSDDGIGIPADFLPHAFDRFRQRDGASTRAYGGLGIGLALARHLADLHGASVAVHSTGPGRGSVFTLSIPIPTAAIRHPEKADVSVAAPAASLARVRVLVVDDEPDAREVARHLLEDAGAVVATAVSARAGLEQIAAFQPDVIVSDIGMPETDGHAFMRQVRALPPEAGGETPAIALTAYASPDDARRAREAGFQVFLAKPLDPRALVATIAELHRSSGSEAPARPR
ncbi:MAG TPA: response regulator [Polyangia bacterium]|nr:response regulator [Polyangia bacterium]